ncbi:MAG: hypothetical protein IKQ46_16580 [Bacteroidales bacterium]|nr:hypothetical protein [Bacteroidales bacterium]
MGKSVTVTNQENGEDVVLVVKKKKFPWWILLFLLPLILLIPVKRDIFVNFTSEGTGIALAKAPAEVTYPMIGTFGSTDYLTKTDSTDTDGNFVINDAKMPLWYKLFGTYIDSLSLSCADGCYELLNGKESYAKFPTDNYKKITVPAKTCVAAIKVVDDDDNQPIPEANVQIISIVNGNDVSTETQTDVAGMFDIERMPLCGSIKAVASKDGYLNDTIEASLFDLNNMSENERTLHLKPMKGNVKVIVKDLKTKTLLAGATVTLNISGQTQTLKTNTNGVGVGSFDSLRVVQQISFKASKSGYADTTLEGYTVQQFMSLSEDKRTMYLRPITKTLVFIDTDGTNPLEGVKNIIYKNGAPIATETSNSKGEFVVSNIGVNDQISIVASKTGYETNSTKVKNKKFSELNTQESRTIPLKEKEEPRPTPPPPVNNNPSDLKGQSGDLRINLQWYSKTDLDLHVIDPCGNEIYFSKRSGNCGGGRGTLDIDANALFGTTNRPQENIYWNKPSPGTYTIKIDCFKWRERVEQPLSYNVTIIDKGVRTDKSGKISKGQKIIVCKHTVE